jgi:hypothetical protein
MNLPMKLDDRDSGAYANGYKHGFKDARHAAAELALTQPPTPQAPAVADALASALDLCVTDAPYSATVGAQNRIADINKIACDALRAAGYSAANGRRVEAQVPAVAVQGDALREARRLAEMFADHGRHLKAYKTLRDALAALSAPPAAEARGSIALPMNPRQLSAEQIHVLLQLENGHMSVFDAWEQIVALAASPSKKS